MTGKTGIFFLLFVVCAFNFATFALAVPVNDETNEILNESVFPTKGMAKCAEAGGVLGVVNCAAVRVLKSLQIASNQPILELLPGIALTSDGSTDKRVGKELREENLPADPSERANKLYELLLENSARVFSGRTLKVKLPENVEEEVSRALEEGRKKKKGKFPSFMLGIGAKMFSFVPAVIGGLALLSTKALIVAKLALVLSAIVFFQYMSGKGASLFGGLGGNYGHGASTGFGGGYSGSYGPPSWTSNTVGSNQYPYARSIDTAEKTAQDLAYAKSK